MCVDEGGVSFGFLFDDEKWPMKMKWKQMDYSVFCSPHGMRRGARVSVQANATHPVCAKFDKY